MVRLNKEVCKTEIIVGDFNSQRVNWGYAHNNPNGNLIEHQAEGNKLEFIYTIQNYLHHIIVQDGNAAISGQYICDK